MELASHLIVEEAELREAKRHGQGHSLASGRAGVSPSLPQARRHVLSLTSCSTFSGNQCSWRLMSFTMTSNRRMTGLQVTLKVVQSEK